MRSASLFDHAGLPQLLGAVEAARRPAGAIVAALRDPALAGGDLVVLGGRWFGSPAPPWAVEPEGRALPVAVGAACARRDATTWCALRAAALGDGRVWEAARAATAAGLARLVLVVLAVEDQVRDAAAMLAACGWSVRHAPSGGPWELLSALDRARAAAAGPGAPTAVVVAAPAERATR